MKSYINKICDNALKLNMSWVSVTVLAVITGVYTGLIVKVPFLENTSFQDIAVTHEWWVLFAMLICLNQNKWWQAAIKTFVFFVISQSVVFLVQWPIVGEFYYAYWYRWMEVSLFTLPGGAFVYFAKVKNFFRDFVLCIPVALLLLLGTLYAVSVVQTPPYHLLTTLFCFGQAAFWLKTVAGNLKNVIITFFFMALFAIAYCVLRFVFQIDLAMLIS